MLTVSELLAHAEDCERLADDAAFQRQRPLLLELAGRWRRLAANVRHDDIIDGDPLAADTVH